MIKNNTTPAFGYCINKNHFKSFTKITENAFLLQEEIHEAYQAVYENEEIHSPEELTFIFLNDFMSYERIDIQALPAFEAGTYYYYNTEMKINGEEVYVAYDTTTFQSTPLVGSAFLNHLRVQQAVTALNSEPQPF